MGWKTKVLGSVPRKDKNLFSPKLPNLPFCPLSLLFIGHRVLFSTGQCGWDHIMSGIRMNGAIPLLPFIRLLILYNTITYVKFCNRFFCG
jgi:hypothetical protein